MPKYDYADTDTLEQRVAKNKLNLEELETDLSAKQDALTSASVTSGTVAKAIGFDADGNMVQGEVAASSSSGSASFTIRRWSE